MSELADETAVVEQPEAVAPENAVEENAAEAAAPEAPAAPTLDPLELQAELEHMRSQNAELYSLLEQFSTQGQTAQQGAAQQGYDISTLTDEYGNLDPAKFAAFQQQQEERIVSRMQEMFNPIQQTFAQQQEASVIAEGEQRLQDILADDVARNGEFASDPTADAEARELVRTLAENMFSEIADRYGQTPRSAEIAMTRAAERVRGLLKTAGGAAVSQTQNQLATLATAHGEPGAHGAGVEAPVIRRGETSAARFAPGN